MSLLRTGARLTNRTGLNVRVVLPRASALEDAAQAAGEEAGVAALTEVRAAGLAVHFSRQRAAG